MPVFISIVSSSWRTEEIKASYDIFAFSLRLDAREARQLWICLADGLFLPSFITWDLVVSGAEESIVICLMIDGLNRLPEVFFSRWELLYCFVSRLAGKNSEALFKLDLVSMFLRVVLALRVTGDFCFDLASLLFCSDLTLGGTSLVAPFC